MNEGWFGDHYLILFEEPEIAEASERYAVSEFLPGFQIVSLRGWDDFIVRDAHGDTYSVPTVPLDSQHLAPLSIPNARPALELDQRFAGKTKWHTTPIALGGDAKVGENMTWVTHEQHAQLMRWWNIRFRSSTE